VDGLFMAVLSNAAAAITLGAGSAFSTPASFIFGRDTSVANLIGERAALILPESA
jgi:hypothetical protein